MKPINILHIIARSIDSFIHALSFREHLGFFSWEVVESRNQGIQLESHDPGNEPERMGAWHE